MVASYISQCSCLGADAQLQWWNTRVAREVTVEFPDAMTAIVGANGTGKSTLLEAVTFVLFSEPAREAFQAAAAVAGVQIAE